MRNTGTFSPNVFALSVTAAVLANWMQSLSGSGLSARAFLLGGLPLAVGLMILSAFLANSGIFSGDTILSRFAQAGLLLWFAAELVSAVRDAQTICWEQFSSMAVIGALPLLVLAGWCLSPQVFSRAAKILWVLVVVVGVICIAGLAGQFRWQNLLETTVVFSRAINKINIPIYAEYFALSLIDSKETSTQTSYRMSWLPLGAFLLEVGCRLGIELLFGSAQDYPGYELLRAWTLGMFSRLDSLFLLVWLTIGLFRICLLTRILRTLAERFFGSTVLNREVES